MKKPKPEPKRKDKKARQLRAKYLEDQKALEAKFKADMDALGYCLVSDEIAKLRDYVRQVMALPSVKKHPELAAELQVVADSAIAKFRATAV